MFVKYMNKLIMNKSINLLHVNWVKESVLQELTKNYVPNRSQVSSNALLQRPLSLHFGCLPLPRNVARDSWGVLEQPELTPGL